MHVLRFYLHGLVQLQDISQKLKVKQKLLFCFHRLRVILNLFCLRGLIQEPDSHSDQNKCAFYKDTTESLRCHWNTLLISPSWALLTFPVWSAGKCSSLFWEILKELGIPKHLGSIFWACAVAPSINLVRVTPTSFCFWLFFSHRCLEEVETNKLKASVKGGLFCSVCWCRWRKRKTKDCCEGTACVPHAHL